ncbi:hypothetical protein Tco_1495752 [Tanacetum coccineum]
MAWNVYGTIVSQYHDIDTPITVPGMANDPAMNCWILRLLCLPLRLFPKGFELPNEIEIELESLRSSLEEIELL